MSLRKNKTNQWDQYSNDNNSQNIINDKSCQKYLFQSRNQNIQNGLPGDNSLIQSYFEVAENQVNTDQFSLSYVISEKTQECKEDINLHQQNYNEDLSLEASKQNEDLNVQQNYLTPQITEGCMKNFQNLQQSFQNGQKNQNQKLSSTFLKDKKLEYKNEVRNSDQSLEQQQKIRDEEYSKYSLSNNMNIAQKIKDFSKKCRNNSKILYQKLLINDLSYFDSSLTQDIKKKNLVNFLINQIQSIPLLSPTSNFIKIWECISLIYLSIFYYFTSILIFFDFELAQTKGFIYLCIFSLFILISDVIVHLNTALVKEEAFVKERKIIILQYLLSFHFLSDAISIVSLSLKIIHWSSFEKQLFMNPCLFKYLLFLKLYSVHIKMTHIEKNFATKFYLNQKLDFIKNVMNIAIAAHIASIGWYEQTKIYSLYYPEGSTWVNQIQIKENEYCSKYIYSFYWAISTLSTGILHQKFNLKIPLNTKSTKYYFHLHCLKQKNFSLKVGNGSFNDLNSLELLYASICIIAFFVVLAFSLSNIILIFQEMYNANKRNQKNAYMIESMLDKRSIDSDLRIKVKQYLLLYDKSFQCPKNTEEIQIISNLPEYLRDEIINQFNKNMFKDFGIFKNFSQKSQNKLVQFVQELHFPPEEIIFKEGDTEDNSIYLLKRGCVQIYLQKSENQKQNIVLCNLSNNQVFGEISFFSGLERTACAKTTKTSTIYKIDKKEFIKVIQQNKGDYEYFKMIQDKIIYQKSFVDLHIQCYSCQKYGHITKYCPCFNQILTLKNKLWRDQQQITEQRKPFKRKLTRTQNARLQLKANDEYEQILSQNDGQKTSFNIYEQDIYTFTQLQDFQKQTNSQLEDSPKKNKSFFQIKGKSTMKENLDKLAKKQQKLMEQSRTTENEEICIFDQNSQEIHQKTQKTSRQISILKNQLTPETCSISDLAKNNNSKINLQQDEETINVTSNLINDFQIKDIPKTKRQNSNQSQHNNEQLFVNNNLINRCSIDQNTNLNQFYDMILNENGQIIYDQIDQVDDSNPKSPISVINQEQSYKQLTKIETYQLQPSYQSKSISQDKSIQQKELQHILMNIKSIFQKYEHNDSFTTFSIDSIYKFKYYFPMNNYDFILKKYQKYILMRTKKKLQDSKRNKNSPKNI